MSIIIVIDFTSHPPTERERDPIRSASTPGPTYQLRDMRKSPVTIPSSSSWSSSACARPKAHCGHSSTKSPFFCLWPIVPSCCNSPESLLDLDVSLWTTWFVRSHPREQYSTFTCQKSPLPWIYSCYWLYLPAGSFVQLGYCCFRVQTSKAGTSIGSSSAGLILQCSYLLFNN